MTPQHKEHTDEERGYLEGIFDTVQSIDRMVEDIRDFLDEHLGSEHYKPDWAYNDFHERDDN